MRSAAARNSKSAVWASLPYIQPISPDMLSRLENFPFEVDRMSTDMRRLLECQLESPLSLTLTLPSAKARHKESIGFSEGSPGGKRWLP